MFIYFQTWLHYQLFLQRLAKAAADQAREDKSAVIREQHVRAAAKVSLLYLVNIEIKNIPWPKQGTILGNFNLLPFLYFSFVGVKIFNTNSTLSFVFTKSGCHMTIINLTEIIDWIKIDHLWL